MNIALMCAEKDPLDCHRIILLAHELISLGREIMHILASGSNCPKVFLDVNRIRD